MYVTQQLAQISHWSQIPVVIWKQPGTCLRVPMNDNYICHAFLKKQSASGKIKHYCAKNKLLHPLKTIKQKKFPQSKTSVNQYTVAAQCTWLRVFSSSDSRVATHSCRTGVMILKSFISASATGTNGSLRLFQKAGKPLEQRVNSSLKAANLPYRETRCSIPQEAEAPRVNNGSDQGRPSLPSCSRHRTIDLSMD